jgi:hypothetical protein
MGKGKRGRGSPRRVGDKRNRDPSPPSEDFGDSEYSEEEVSSESDGSLALASPPMSSDDSDDSQGLATEVWTYIRSIEHAGLEGSDESEVSSNEENSFGSSEERSGDDSDDDDGSGKGDDVGGKGGEGDDGGDGDGGGKDSSGGGKASGKAPVV